MAADIQLKRSSVAGRKPDAANIAVGEPVVNLVDRVIYTKDGNGNVITIGANLTVQLVNSSNSAITSVADVRTIQFDDNSGFDVVDRANGIAKVQMNSTFKTWNVYGQANLVAQGLDTVNIAAGDFINITTNASASPQQIKFALSNTLTTSNVAEGANLYFSNARAIAAFTPGNNITIDSNGLITANVTGGGGGATTTVSSTPPGSPNNGDFWIDSDTGYYFIYLNDGNSSQWVEFNSAGSGGGSGSSSSYGDSNVITLLSSYSNNSITTTGNVTAGNVSANLITAVGAIYENAQNITANTSITSGRNAMSAGPITVDPGVTVTVPSGSRWVIV